MIATDKLIICVALTGNFQGKEANPNLPEQPDEIADDVYRCWNEGASIAHIHARDRKGAPTSDPDVFREIDRLIREKECDIIIEHSTAHPYPGVPVEEGTKSVEANPEMASLNMGVSAGYYKDQIDIAHWTRPFLQKYSKVMLDKGIKPEMEIYNPAQIEDVYTLIDMGLLRRPYWLSFVLDMHRIVQGAIRYTPRNLMHYLDWLPQDSMFSVLGVARAELPATTMSMLLGGHVRVGLEDNIHYSRGVLATNAQLVARAARYGKELGREVATPDEARGLLGIPKLQL